MLWAPLVGLLVGAVAGACGAALLALGGGPLLAAVGATAVPAVLTRGLHLDGLADTADGLGSGRPPAQALSVMKRSDIGPFGVLTLVLALLAQVAALDVRFGAGWAPGAVAAAVAALTARMAMTLACREGVPAARPDGLGAVVAGGVPRRAAWTAASLAVLATTAAGALFGPYPAVHQALAALAGLGAGELLLRRCRARLGGVTGDVFGALAESAATTCLVVLALQ
jgi:adenosylcobinamide-GDP ribazoletransferase